FSVSIQLPPCSTLFPYTTLFRSKFEENGEVKLGSIESITELASGTSFKYVRATLEVDQSTDVVNNLTDTRNPIMKEETLFLKTLDRKSTRLNSSHVKSSYAVFCL